MITVRNLAIPDVTNDQTAKSQWGYGGQSKTLKCSASAGDFWHSHGTSAENLFTPCVLICTSSYWPFERLYFLNLWKTQFVPLSKHFSSRL